MSQKKKEILDRGYVTHALTNEQGQIYGLQKDHYINWEHNPIERNHCFYWSEVYCESHGSPGLVMIIRTGMCLSFDITPEALSKLHEQSKINLH